MQEGLSRFARRIGSRAEPTTLAPSARRPWWLRVLQPLFVLPFLSGLLTADPLTALGAVIAFVAFRIADGRMQRGFAQEEAYAARDIAEAPPPLKLQASGIIGLGLLSLALFSGQGIGMALAYGLLGTLASILAYGLDPWNDKGPAETLRQAGMSASEVVGVLREARAKVAAIRADAQAIAGLELKRHLNLIASRADVILDQLERGPKDMRRARRFLVTYLDGTRDVVAKYCEQQHDVAGTELARNFREVLHTVEHVFEEQERELKTKDTLDLEVEIDALRAQMGREGVGR